MAWALSMGMIRSRESEFGRASSGPTSLRHRKTGCRTSHEFADRGDRQIEKMASWTQAKIKHSRMDEIGLKFHPDVGQSLADPSPFGRPATSVRRQLQDNPAGRRWCDAGKGSRLHDPLGRKRRASAGCLL